MITELELLENKINKIDIINRIIIIIKKKIIRKGLNKLKVKRINKIKDLGDIETELRKLEIKIKKELIKKRN